MAITRVLFTPIVQVSLNRVVWQKIHLHPLSRPAGLYNSKYSPEQLQEWVEKIRTFGKEHDVYGYFNNDLSGFAIANAQGLRSLLADQGRGPVIAGKST